MSRRDISGNNSNNYNYYNQNNNNNNNNTNNNNNANNNNYQTVASYNNNSNNNNGSTNNNSLNNSQINRNNAPMTINEFIDERRSSGGILARYDIRLTKPRSVDVQDFKMRTAVDAFQANLRIMKYRR